MKVNTNTVPAKIYPTSKQARAYSWHVALNHTSLKRLKMISKSKKIAATNSIQWPTDADFTCTACMNGKAAKAPYPKVENRVHKHHLRISVHHGPYASSEWRRLQTCPDNDRRPISFGDSNTNGVKGSTHRHHNTCHNRAAMPITMSHIIIAHRKHSKIPQSRNRRGHVINRSANR